MRVVELIRSKAQWLWSTPGIPMGVSLLLLGALLIPTDPFLEEVWDAAHDVLPIEAAALLLLRSASPIGILIVAALAVVFGGSRRWRLAAASLIAGGGVVALVVVFDLLAGWLHPASQLQPDAFAPLTYGFLQNHFPSDAAAVAVVVGALLAIVFPRLRPLAMAWTAIVGLAAVTADRHFFGDVLAGWGIGLAVVSLAAKSMGVTVAEEGPLSRLLRRRARLHALCAAAILLVSMPTELTNIVGGAVILAGALVRIWALGHIEKNKRVCRSGPYALVRHPLYLSSIIVTFGVCVMANWWVLTSLLMVSAFAVHVWLIRGEEEYLCSEFGDEYVSYRREVPALVPTWRSVSSSIFQGRYDWSVAMANRAFGVLPLVLLAYLLMAGKQELFERVADAQFLTTFGLMMW